MELDARKLRVLAAIVETYIATGEPVSSKLVAYLMGGEVSSATVRNDMAALYEMGLIEQPHTSAGRIPSHLGYRVYIDRLIRFKPLTQEEKDEIDALFNVGDPDPDRLLADAAQALASQTKYATISTTFTPRDVYVKRIELVPVGSHTVVILVVASNGVIKNKVCRVEFEVTPKICEFFTNFANGRLAGVSLNEISAKFIQSATMSLGEYSRLFNPLLLAIFEICKETYDGQYVQKGAANLLSYEELRQIAHELFALLNRREDVLNLISGDQSDVQITIGKENTHMELAGSSVIVSRFKIGDQNAGAVGIIGPVRMDYARIVPHLKYFTETLGRLLSETLESQ